MFLARIGWRRCGRPTGPDRAAELVATATSFSTPWGRSESRLQATGGSVLWLAWAVCYITAMGRMRLPFFHVDDLLWITQSSDGLLRILASILLLSVLGVPFAWHKFSGGGEHTWIGYSLCVAKRTVGISLSRADWVIGWIRKTRWFSEKIDHLKFPLFFMSGQSYRSIGNAFITARWMTTSFPLNAVLMELAAILQQRSLRLDLHWAPRLQNALADALTNQQYESFSSDRRLRFDFSRYQSIILNDLMKAGEVLYGDIREFKEKLQGKRAAKLKKGQRLRDLDPWS
eukprot:s7427_g2.t1